MYKCCFIVGKLCALEGFYSFFSLPVWLMLFSFILLKRKQNVDEKRKDIWKVRGSYFGVRGVWTEMLSLLNKR